MLVERSWPTGLPVEPCLLDTKCLESCIYWPFWVLKQRDPCMDSIPFGPQNSRFPKLQGQNQVRWAKKSIAAYNLKVVSANHVGPSRCAQMQSLAVGICSCSCVFGLWTYVLMPSFPFWVITAWAWHLWATLDHNRCFTFSWKAIVYSVLVGLFCRLRSCSHHLAISKLTIKQPLDECRHLSTEAVHWQVFIEFEFPSTFQKSLLFLWYWPFLCHCVPKEGTLTQWMTGKVYCELKQCSLWMKGGRNAGCFLYSTWWSSNSLLCWCE